MVQGRAVRIGRKRLFRLQLSELPGAVLLLFYLFLASLPVLYTVLTAFKPLDEMFVYPPRWIPRYFTLTNFSRMGELLQDTVMPISRYLFNSVAYCLMMVTAVVVTSFMAAYAMAKIRPRGSAGMVGLLIFALSLSGPAAGVANFLIIEKLGLLDTWLALILPGCGSATYVFLMRQFIVSMPDTYVEAARLDGANEWQIMWKIGCPYARPAWATVIVYQFMASWNDSSGPFLYLSDPSMQTLPFALGTIGGSLTTAGAAAAISLLMLVPSVIVFVLLQSRIMKTMAFAGLKE